MPRSDIMCIKYLVYCSLSLLFINHALAKVLLDVNKKSANNNLTVDLDDTERTIVNAIDRPSKTNTTTAVKEIKDIMKNLTDIEKKLNVIEERTKILRSAYDFSTKSDRDSKSVNLKSEEDFIANNKLYNEFLFNTAVIDLDDVDNHMINKTGCKYLSLKKDEMQVYHTDSHVMSRINEALHQFSAYRHIPKVDFETHMAVRSTGNLYILLWETKPNLSTELQPHYEIGLGVRSNGATITYLKSKEKGFWKRMTTPYILMPTQYNKFYVKIYNDFFEIGSKCDEAPIHRHRIPFTGNIVTLGFLSTAVDGAKILFDCPASKCADK